MSHTTTPHRAESAPPAPGPRDTPTVRGRSVFISYTREDHESTREVANGFQLLGGDVWLDEGLVGGQDWWREILARIRACDIFVPTISAASIESDACERERAYAAALGKPILPVALEHLPAAVFPGDLAGLQSVDYADVTPESAFRLARALDAVPTAPPLPDPLPPAPPTPVSYLGELGERIRAPELSLDDQLAIVARLRGAADRPKERDAAERLLGELQARRDLFHSVARDVERTLEEIATARGAVAATPLGAEPTPAPPDPPATATVVRPTPHWGLAVGAVLLFVPTGIFAIINAARVEPALARGDPAAAVHASARVRTLFWWSVAAFVVLLIILSSS